MPPSTVVPIDCRLVAPAPPATARGITPKNKSERGHQDGTEPQPRRFHRRFDDAETFFASTLGEFGDQDGVLGGQADQHHQADLAINIELATA